MEPEKTLHYSKGKLALDQIPPEVLAIYALVFTYGEQKYERDNWKKGGVPWSEWFGSAKRHLDAFWLGETDDPESGLPHLAHAIWNIGTLYYYWNHDLGVDNRGLQGVGEEDALDQDPTGMLSYVRGMLEDIDERVSAYKKMAAKRDWVTQQSPEVDMGPTFTEEAEKGCGCVDCSEDGRSCEEKCEPHDDDEVCEGCAEQESGFLAIVPDFATDEDLENLHMAVTLEQERRRGFHA